MRATLRPGLAGGVLAVPPSKSMAHRAVICAALAEGTSTLRNVQYSADITATVCAMGQLGATLVPEGNCLRVQGCGGRLQAPAQPVNCNESGSTLRFLWPLFSLTGEPVTFTGAGRLMERPLTVYENIAREQGLRTGRDSRSVSVCGPLRPGRYSLPGDVSSQFISGLALALPLLEEDSLLCVRPPFESCSYVELTVRAMASFGVRAVWRDENTLALSGGQRYAHADYTVEGDYSQAAFGAVLGAALGGVTLTGLAADTAQGDAVILPVLRRCGAQFVQDENGLHFTAAPLAATEIDLSDCPDLGPVLMVLGALCQGETVLTHAARLRIKESDRIAAMEQELAKFGVDIASTEDTVTVRGRGRASLREPAEPLFGHNDHRVVMSLAVLALAAGVPAVMEGTEAVGKSWPEFFEALRGLGAAVEWENG